MKYLSKFWIRLVLSIVGGIVITEAVIASTGTGLYKPFLIFFWIGIVYFTLTGILMLYNWNKVNSEK